MNYYNNFDVIVIGGGHAGTEAALVSAKMKKKTLLITNNIDNIGAMSCNPSIGGIGKGHLVKEIDAIGGIMATAIDYSGIQFRILNSSKGPAVRATRAQADRKLYKKQIQKILINQNNLTILEQEVIELIVKKYSVIGVVTNIGVKFISKAVVLSTGTFLNGIIHIGNNSYPGGRSGELSSILLTKCLKKFAFKIGRMKTGTPPRIYKNSINFNNLNIQLSDKPLPIFSFWSKISQHPKQLPCYITYTNHYTHEIIKNNLINSPIYNGNITGNGPRYCPSIEDKIIKFPKKNSHQIFLEPEGIDSNEIYPNGISTSMPYKIQQNIINSINGLQNANIIRPGYAIEYDYFNPIDLKLTLESKILSKLFLAGQINGTTGYEEAAAQGLLAGINAALTASEKECWYPYRDQAYIGVLIDDLCTLGITEPYRMFTSRSENRLLLREDNADLRLTEIGRNFGIIDDFKWKKFCIKVEKIEKEKQRLRNIYIYPKNKNINSIINKMKISLKNKINGEELLKRTDINYKKLTFKKPFFPPLKDNIVSEQIEIQIKYKGYIKKQNKEIYFARKNENTKLPININYNIIKGLSNEVVNILNIHKPMSIGQASRIPGITPVAISLLLIWIKKNI